MQARFYNLVELPSHATFSQIFRLTNSRPINKYFWEKEKAEVVEALAKKYNINKTDIKVEEDGKI